MANEQGLAQAGNLLFEISRRLNKLNVLDRLLFMFRGKLASGSEDIIQDALSLFKELEEQNILGADRLVEMKELLNGVEEWSLLEKVEKFESKRKEYHDLVEQIVRALNELNELERLIAMCRGKISEESEGHIHDVRSLFKELENQNNLGIHHLDILKAILTEMGNNELLKEVEKFEERRKREAAIKRKKAKAAAFVSSVGNKLTGVLNIKTVFKAVAVVSTAELLIGWSTYDQLVTAVNTCVLPAGTSLVNLTDGCVCLTVQAETLSALTTLWNLYQDGTLEKRLYNFFVTDEVKERAGGETVEVNVTIEEEDYDKACRELINEVRETARIDDGERLRRNSDSALFFRPKEETPVLKIIIERIAVLERKIQQLPPEILEDCSPEEKATKFSRQQESWKGNNKNFTEHGGKRCCQSRRSILLRYKKEKKEKQNKKHSA